MSIPKGRKMAIKYTRMLTVVILGMRALTSLFMCLFCVLLCNFQISHYKYVFLCNQIKINVVKMKKVQQKAYRAFK